MLDAVRRAGTPLGILALTAALAAVLLSLPLRLPIGPNYWDLYTYVDTAYRVAAGQVPHVDFFVPVGSLGYALYIGLTKVFPQAHTLLAVHFAILLVALPLLAVVVWEAAKRSRLEAALLAMPFALFGLIPINGQELYPSPGLDGYGNYNRHVALLLYVLASTLLYVENRGRAALLAALLLGIMFMTKVTGLAVGAGLVLHAALAGRLSWRGFALGSLVVAAALALVEWRSGLVGAYVADIVELVAVNTGSLLPRVLTVMSTKLDVAAAAGLLILVILWRSRREILDDLGGFVAGEKLRSLRRLLNHDAVWLLSLLGAGAVFETQNTGSHEFILLWPALLRLFRDLPLPYGRGEALVLMLVAATALPTPINILHKLARVSVSALKYEPVNAPLMGPFGRVSAKPEIMHQSRAMLAHYPQALASYELFAKRNTLPSYILFSEIDFQVSWIVSTEEAARALLAYEQANGKHFRRIATMDFVDPLPVMLGREPLREMSIGNDPERTLMRLNDKARAEIASADAILLPKCPVTAARNAIANVYVPSLEGRRVVNLTPCFQMLVRE